MPSTTAPTAVVQRQLDAYNARDLDALLAVYAPDAALYQHPDTLLAHGTAALRERFTPRLTEPNLHARLIHRTVLGDLVVDTETITRTFPEGPGELDCVMIYRVADNHITHAWSIVGEKRLSPNAGLS